MPTAHVTVPAAPPLATIRAVPLMHIGQWNAMTGTAVFTSDDFAAAVAAMDCPAVRRPILKFGHDGAHGVGMPALGSVDNLALVDDGVTLVGDYVGMPGWLATSDANGNSVLSSAYPDRSIEGEWDYHCQIGHVHPFVVHAVALLGEERPAIGTLPSLQDLAALYGVALATPDPTGVPVLLTVTAKEAGVPNPRPTQVAAGVSTEDIRRDYYDKAPWSYWIVEFHVNPLQLVVVDDDTGKRYRVPVTVTGEDTFEFGDAVEVLIRYVDAATGGEVAASAGTQRIVFASRAESRPGMRPAASNPAVESTPPVDEPAPVEDPEPVPPVPAVGTPITDVPAAESDAPTIQEDTMSLSAIRARLGLADDADEGAVLAALDARLPSGSDDGTTDPPETPAAVPAPEPVAASTRMLPDGVVTIDAATLDELRRGAALGAQAAERQRVSDRDRFIDAAVQDGKIAPARKGHWTQAWEADPEGAKATLSALEPGLVVPTVMAGATGTGEETADLLGVSSGEAGDWASQLGISAEELSRG